MQTLKNLNKKQIAGLILLALVLYYGLAAVFGKSVVEKALLVAHRGGPVYQPENTIAAFEQAIADGVDVLEFDVQITSDGYLIVFHDDTVDRTTNGTGNVKEMTLEEIRGLDAGEGQKVPLFEEVIDLAKGAGIDIMPEAKSPLNFPGIEEAITAAIVESDYQDHTIVQSFVGETLDNFETVDASIQLCQLYGLWKLSVPDPQPGHAKNACVMAEMLILNPWMIQAAHADGYTVYVWFGALENSFMTRFILALGADGIMTDDQLMVLNVLDR